MEPNWTPLTTAERSELLRTARDSIAAALRGDAAPPCASPTPSLKARNGVFVSLHAHEELRGCVGTLTADRPLHESVGRLAVVAAFDDPRFAPVNESELTAIAIEISRLTDPIRVQADEIVVGRDGVCIVHRSRRAILLPQVAPHYGWDRERLLCELCRKADLSPDAWRHAGELFRFEAEVFGDEGVARE